MRFLRLLPILLALSCGGCALFKKKPKDTTAVDNSRAIEQRRVRALDYGDVASNRGAEILIPDYTKQFDPNQSGIGAARKFGTGGARAKEFNFDQKTQTPSFFARTFLKTKGSTTTDKKFATSDANTLAKNTIPNVNKDAGAKAAMTKELWDGNKVASTQDLSDGKRPYLGPESKKLSKTTDPKELANWRTGGNESVMYGNGTVERIGNLKQLSIEDVRELLNKNK